MSEPVPGVEQLRTRLVSFLVEYTGDDELASVHDDTDLADCGLDSISVFNFLLELEKRFELAIPEADFTYEKLRSFGGVLKVLGDNLEACSS